MSFYLCHFIILQKHKTVWLNKLRNVYVLLNILFIAKYRSISVDKRQKPLSDCPLRGNPNRREFQISKTKTIIW